jgi:hypothetical protein
MQITIETADLLPDGRRHVSVAARWGSADAVWRGSDVRPGDVCQVELTLLDELELNRNAYVTPQDAFALSTTAKLVLITARVEWVDPDGVPGLRLGTIAFSLRNSLTQLRNPVSG